MKKVLNIVVALVFGYSHTVRAYTADFDASYKATRVSWMLKDFLVGKYSLDTTHLHKEDREYLALLKNERLSKVLSKLKVTVQDNALILSFENKTAAILEIETDGVAISGNPIKLNPSISITQNLRNWGLRSKKNTARLKENLFLNVFVSEAQASPITKQASEAAKEVVSSGAETVLEANAARLYAARYATTALAAAPAASATTILIATTVSVVAALAVIAVVACEAEAAANAPRFGTSKSQERLNCYSKPLSWANINPRDRMHAQDITCSPKTIEIEFESQTHVQASIELVFKGEKLVAVKPDIPELRQKIANEVSYFRQLCKDEKTLQRFRNAVSNERAQGRVYTKSPANSTPGAK